MRKIGVALPEATLERIDEVVDDRDDLASRSEAIRRWTELGMAVDDVFESEGPRLDERARRATATQAVVDELNDEFGE